MSPFEKKKGLNLTFAFNIWNTNLTKILFKNRWTTDNKSKFCCIRYLIPNTPNAHKI